MKTFLKTITAIICISIFFSSCQNTEETLEDTLKIPNQDQYLICKINGVDFLSKDDPLFSYVKIFSVAGNTTYQFVAKDETTNGIGFLFVNKFNGVGTYNIKDNTNGSNVSFGYTINAVKSYGTDGGNSAPANTTHGTITITASNDTYIEGTFTFKAVAPDWSDTSNPDFSDVVDVTDGEFKLKIK